MFELGGKSNARSLELYQVSRDWIFAEGYKVDCTTLF